MTAYLISYDLHKAGQNYTELYEEIKKYEFYWHYLDSTWIIRTNDTVGKVSEKLKTHLDDNDSLLVIEIKNNRQGWLPQKAWDYLNDVIFK